MSYINYNRIILDRLNRDFPNNNFEIFEIKQSNKYSLYCNGQELNIYWDVEFHKGLKQICGVKIEDEMANIIGYEVYHKFHPEEVITI